MSVYRYDFPEASPRRSRQNWKLIYIAFDKYASDWPSIQHSHKCMELFYVVDGTGQFVIDGKVLSVKKDDLVLVNAMVQHTERSIQEQPLEYVVVGVEGLDLTHMSPDGRFCLVSLGECSEYIRFCLDRSFQEVQAQKIGYEDVCQDMIDAILVEAERKMNRPSVFSAARPVRQECADVKRYIETHFKEKLTLDQLAQVAQVNKFHMAHEFSRDYGVSPISYLNSCRIAESRYLLQTTDMSLSSIAQALGFSSPSYFSQSFRRHEGISPQAFRQNSQKTK